jgi:hypothetical protein
VRIECIFLRVLVLFIYKQVLDILTIHVVKFDQYIHPKPMGLINRMLYFTCSCVVHI